MQTSPLEVRARAAPVTSPRPKPPLAPRTGRRPGVGQPAAVTGPRPVGAEVLARLAGVAATTGSACHAGSVELSPVLAAMGVPQREGMGTVRFSLGRTTTSEELEQVLAMLTPGGSPI